LTWRDFTPPVVNDALATEHLRTAAAAVLGDAAVIAGPMMMVAEDVSEFLNRTPGSFFVLGAMPESTRPEPHHSPRFDIDERALPLGAAILAQATCDWLSRHAVSR
jgi:metal-dependent amidase/aminoacylase/carboxypeptidase family protein